jgi:hypothetical protein
MTNRRRSTKRHTQKKYGGCSITIEDTNKIFDQITDKDDKLNRNEYYRNNFYSIICEYNDKFNYHENNVFSKKINSEKRKDFKPKVKKTMNNRLKLELTDSELEQIIRLIEQPDGSRSPVPSAPPTPTPYPSMKPHHYPHTPKYSKTKSYRRERGRIYTVKNPRSK